MSHEGTPIHWILQVRKRLLWEVCDLPEPSCWKRWAGFAACVSVFSASSISLQLHQGRGLREMESLSETDGPLLPHDPLGFLFRLADGSTQGKITSRRLRPRKERGLLLLPGVWQVSDLYHGPGMDGCAPLGPCYESPLPRLQHLGGWFTPQSEIII